jgi:hypothetical protein
MDIEQDDLETARNKAYVRLEDESPQERRAREKYLNEILKQKPTEEQLQPVGEPSLKAARVLGEPKLATKSAAGLAFLGEDYHYDAEAVRRANQDWIEEKLRRRSLALAALEASLGLPTKEQLDYPEAARNKPVSIKAMQILGDEGLAMKAKRQIKDTERPSLKALKVFGSASSLAPPKARQILGSSEDDGEARALADRVWLEEMVRKADEFTKEVMARKPDERLKAIPMNNGPVAEKALAFFGDEGLKRKSLRALKYRAPPKAIHILGEAGLAGTKAELLTGGALEDFNPKKKPSFSPLRGYRKLFRTFAVVNESRRLS